MYNLAKLLGKKTIKFEMRRGAYSIIGKKLFSKKLLKIESRNFRPIFIRLNAPCPKFTARVYVSLRYAIAVVVKGARKIGRQGV